MAFSVRQLLITDNSVGWNGTATPFTVCHSYVIAAAVRGQAKQLTRFESMENRTAEGLTLYQSSQQMVEQTSRMRSPSVGDMLTRRPLGLG